MKKIILFFIVSFMMFACETSSGKKEGVLMKVTHRNPMICSDYYVAEIAYEGFRQVEKGMSNSQEFQISKELFIKMDSIVGHKVIFQYHETWYEGCGLSHKLTSFKLLE